MPTCCNFKCNYFTKRIRCGKCRRKGVSECICCDESLQNHNKFYCVECALMSRQSWSKEYQQGIGAEIKAKYSLKYYKIHREDILLHHKNKRLSKSITVNNHAN